VCVSRVSCYFQKMNVFLVIFNCVVSAKTSTATSVTTTYGTVLECWHDTPPGSIVEEITCNDGSNFFGQGALCEGGVTALC
jgi:hypothetical protein